MASLLFNLGSPRRMVSTSSRRNGRGLQKRPIPLAISANTALTVGDSPSRAPWRNAEEASAPANVLRAAREFILARRADISPDLFANFINRKAQVEIIRHVLVNSKAGKGRRSARL
jgi:hypothetical protein